MITTTDPSAGAGEGHFDLSDSYLHLGPPPSWEDTAIAVNGRAVVQACERLDRSLGRAPATEPPGLALGL